MCAWPATNTIREPIAKSSVATTGPAPVHPDCRPACSTVGCRTYQVASYCDSAAPSHIAGSASSSTSHDAPVGNSPTPWPAPLSRMSANMTTAPMVAARKLHHYASAASDASPGHSVARSNRTGLASFPSIGTPTISSAGHRTTAIAGTAPWQALRDARCARGDPQADTGPATWSHRLTRSTPHGASRLITRPANSVYACRPVAAHGSSRGNSNFARFYGRIAVLAGATVVVRRVLPLLLAAAISYRRMQEVRFPRPTYGLPDPMSVHTP